MTLTDLIPTTARRSFPASLTNIFLSSLHKLKQLLDQRLLLASWVCWKRQTYWSPRALWDLCHRGRAVGMDSWVRLKFCLTPTLTDFIMVFKTKRNDKIMFSLPSVGWFNGFEFLAVFLLDLLPSGDTVTVFPSTFRGSAQIQQGK